MKSTKEYDVTAHAIGFNKVRVQYRRERRGLISSIISKKIGTKDTISFLKQNIPDSIPQHDHKQFIQSVYDDLELMDSSRVVGLGITGEELIDWLKIYES